MKHLIDRMETLALLPQDILLTLARCSRIRRFLFQLLQENKYQQTAAYDTDR
jgi:hypothetical protein